MLVSCDRCFFCKNNFCRVNPPDVITGGETIFPKICVDKYPCGEFLDRETGMNIEDILKKKARNDSFHQKPQQQKP
jgi:hypothetical protein